MRISSGDQSDSQALEGKKSALDSELWHACAGPLVSLPSAGRHVVYFPQGHSEQVAASTNKEVDARIPNYPSLSPQLICQLHDVTMHADVETDEVYAQMTLQPLSLQEQKEAYLPAEFCAPSKQPTNYFCKILTASDTSTHGGFSVPRRAAEKVFPPLDFSQQPPVQELITKDLHGNEWKFRHIFRGQPKRHLLTTGWSVFVSAKRLVAGDSVLFTWNEKNQLLVGIRRANRPQTDMPSSVVSSDSMHIGLLAAAAHAASTNSRFTVFYNPRTSPSEFVVPLAKYVKAVYHTLVSIGMRFRMLFETEESSVRRHMGTITGISDLDPERWPGSHWRSVKVGWDESTAGDKRPRVSLWEIEPLTTFPVYPSPFHLGLKRPWPTGMPYFPGQNADLGIQSLSFQGIGGVVPWAHPRVDASIVGLQSDRYQAIMGAAAVQDIRGLDPKASSTSILQLLQHQNLTSKSAALVQNQMLPQCQSQQTFLPGAQQNQNQQLQHQQLLYNQQKQALPQLQQMSNAIVARSQSGLAPQSHPPLVQAISSQCQQQTLCDSNENFMMNTVASPLHSLFSSFSQDESSLLPGLPKANLSMTSSGYPSKRTAVGFGVMSQGAEFGQTQMNVSQNTSSLPPFPGKECSDETDLQNNLFGSITEPSTVLNRMASGGGVGGRNDSTNLPFPSSNYLSTTGADFSLNPSETTSSCIDDSGLLQSSENVDQVSPSTTTFVKVYKSGTFGRSLDITKFSNYNELRSELARMFNLEGKLEEPIRSGWQLVFVDRENDVLLLGDDPWPEFVNSVWCIKILSPQEVQLMGKYGAELLSSVPVQQLSNSNCDDYARQQDSRNLGTTVTSVGSFEY